MSVIRESVACICLCQVWHLCPHRSSGAVLSQAHICWSAQQNTSRELLCLQHKGLPVSIQLRLSPEPAGCSWTPLWFSPPASPSPRVMCWISSGLWRKLRATLRAAAESQSPHRDPSGPGCSSLVSLWFQPFYFRHVIPSNPLKYHKELFIHRADWFWCTPTGRVIRATRLWCTRWSGYSGIYSFVAW